MTSWVFQADPKRFDIDGFLATGPAAMAFLVTRGAKDMRVGDTVYIWRAIGGGDEKLSGVLAQAEMIAEPVTRPDHPLSKSFWAVPTEVDEPAIRAELRFVRIALKDRLKRGWLADDPVLKNMTIIRQPAATNFRLTDAEATRMSAVFSRAGELWDYAECVAGLWAHWRTIDKELSKLPNSPVAEVALKTGRVIPSVYNKVMNFRHLDPKSKQAGFSQVSQQDRKVFASFFDANEKALDGASLSAEYKRLWSDMPIDLPTAGTQAVAREASSLRKLTLAQLLERWAAKAPQMPQRPRGRQSQVRQFDRDPLVVAVAIARAKHSCEIPGCVEPAFIGEDGLPFIEVHHIHSLATGGSDRPENVACVCPNHHREAHHGKNAAMIAVVLTAKRSAEVN